MQQHPVPQPITSYEFRLVGDMTLKQFGKLAAGIILALIVYAVNPPGFIKWPLIFIFVSLGLALAFLPLNGRSLDAWFIAFFKRIYSPTLYLWQTRNKDNTQVEKKREIPVSMTAPKIGEQTMTNPTTLPLAEQPVVKAVTQPASRPKPVLPYIPKPPANAAGQRPKPKVEPRFLTNMAIPAPPSMPNIIVGYVHTPDKKIIDGAIIEIREAQGVPVRALKTNQLGQFQTATPLANNTYEIEIEKEGYFFDIIKVNLTGQKIPPIEIVSKSLN